MAAVIIDHDIPGRGPAAPPSSTTSFHVVTTLYNPSHVSCFSQKMFIMTCACSPLTITAQQFVGGVLAGSSPEEAQNLLRINACQLGGPPSQWLLETNGQFYFRVRVGGMLYHFDDPAGGEPWSLFRDRYIKAYLRTK